LGAAPIHPGMKTMGTASGKNQKKGREKDLSQEFIHGYLMENKKPERDLFTKGTPYPSAQITGGYNDFFNDDRTKTGNTLERER